jgi:GWxTD domain-containing protein
MSRLNEIARSVAFLGCLLGPGLATAGQKREAKNDWLDGPVQYLVTEQERQVYERLTTEAERERFIENFWRRRDPQAETPVNEFREEFFDRVAYANENFMAGAPGWRTDRGRIYILYGPPNRRDAHPMGGRYQKPPSQGGDTITTYPFEVWEYDHIPGIGSDISIEFVDRSHTGLYTIETDPNRKDVFFWRRGAMPQQRTFLRPKETPFERLRVWASLQSPPPLRFPKLKEETQAKVIFDALPFDVSTDFVRMSPESYAVPLSVSVPNNKLMYAGRDGIYKSELQIYASVTNLNGALVYQFDDTFRSPSEDLPFPELLKRQSYHQRIVPLQPGRYKIRLVLKDANSGRAGVQETSIWIPQPGEVGPNTSSLIFADVIQPAQEGSRGEEFILGPLKVIPNMKASFPRRHRMGLYFEVYDLEIDAATKKPSVEVSYSLERKDGSRIPIGKEFESRFAEGRSMAISKAVPLENIPPGKYGVIVRISDLLTERTCTLEGGVEIL